MLVISPIYTPTLARDLQFYEKAYNFTVTILTTVTTVTTVTTFTTAISIRNVISIITGPNATTIIVKYIALLLYYSRITFYLLLANKDFGNI